MIAGVDEVGRGALAGDVYAAAVIFPEDAILLGLKDSKALTLKQRERFCLQIQETAIAYAIGTATVAEIDKLNILQASLLAMARAVNKLPQKPTLLMVDGHILPPLTLPMRAVIGGDRLVPVISAASIVAKVHRDQYMLQEHALYPQYSFAANKGYGTKQHLAALKAYGPSDLHRYSFRPVAAVTKS